jgi:hypothetical protein
MNIIKLILIAICVIYLANSCASHPSVLPQTPKKGEVNSGFSFSLENIVPVMWWRYGLSKYADVGLRVGIPISGSGIDFNRILYKKDERWEVINFAYNFTQNQSFDLTYYSFKGVQRNKIFNPALIKWNGYRLMYIPKGISGGTSIRLGFLTGQRISKRWGYEVGYFHDFRSMPLSKVIGGSDAKGSWDPNDQAVIDEYGDAYKSYPHQHYGLPSEYSRGTGLSFQIFMYLEKK